MTERLYLHDSYLTRFRARIVDHTERQGTVWLALDRSAFYPESGGQPADRGTINDQLVLDVQLDDHGVVWHQLAAPLTDSAVEAIVDWPRRFDHMQQHHGQHLLSAACEQLWGWKTVAFHLGASTATIDLDVASISLEHIHAVLDLANQVIWEDRPVEVLELPYDQALQLPLRKPPTVTGMVRVVIVPEYDYSACGGTHPQATGGVGLIHIRRWERRGTTTRLEFVCGGRALRDYRQRDMIVSRLSSSLSVAADDLEATIERLRASEAGYRKRLEEQAQQLVGYEALQLLAEAELTPYGPCVAKGWAARSIDEVRLLAQAIAAAGGVALLGCGETRAQLVFARPASSSLACHTLLREVLQPYGGKGGGQPGLAQGGLPHADQLADVLRLAAQQVRSAS